MVGDVVVLFLIGFGQVGHILRQLFDSSLAQCQFIHQLADLCFLVSDALVEVVNKLLQFAVFLSEACNLGVQRSNLLLVLRQNIVDFSQLISDLTFDARAHFRIALL